MIAYLFRFPRAPRPAACTRFPLVFFTLTLSLILSGCGTSQSALRKKAHDHFAQGDIPAAIKETLSREVLDEEQNRLLTLLELGTYAHYQGNYEQSNLAFFRAKNLARELYTTSIREQIATGLLNDNAASYTGLEYEISLLHYLIATNFLLMAQTNHLPAWEQEEVRSKNQLIFAKQAFPAKELSPRDRSDALAKARAELLDWNAFLREVRERNRGQPYYKDDLLNKVFAAFVHRKVGTNQDKNIAQQLLKDADKLLVSAYSAYPAFNAKSAEYIDNYKKFESLGADTVRERFIEKTPYYNATEALINQAQAAAGNVFVLVEFGMAPSRKEKTYVIGLSTLFREIKDPQLRRQIEELGTHVLLQFAPQLGLSFAGAAVVGSIAGSDAEGEKPKFISDAVDSVIGFSFKLPNVEPSPVTETLELHISHVNGGAMIQSPVVLLSPITDIAKLNIDRRANAMALKTGIRVGLKYLAALVPAILTYKRIDGPEFAKMLAATAVWMAGKRIVDATEAADLRAWALLPKWVGASELNLPPAEYDMSLVDRGSGAVHARTKLKVEANKPVLHKLRVMQQQPMILPRLQ